MMSRYQSRYRWQKIQAGVYESPHDGPDGHYIAVKGSNCWSLAYRWGEGAFRNTTDIGTYLSLADCQEIAAKRERDKWTTI